ncbi:hypothetical protein V2I01_13880 [Micromonospora sp. BRA006-A]|nr:hypothetical protein [Micromonospora sp. BRA006-A]
MPPDRLGETLTRHFVRRWEADGTLVALLRAAATEPGAAERMRGIFAGQLAVAVARTGADPATADRRAGLVASQILGLALTRYVVRLPPVADLDPEELADWVGPTIQRYLTQPLPRPARLAGDGGGAGWGVTRTTDGRTTSPSSSRTSTGCCAPRT